MNEATKIWVINRQRACALTGKFVPARVAVQIQHIQLPMRGKLLTEHVRFPKVVTCVQKKDQDITSDQGCHVQQRHGLRLKRRTQRDLRPECIYGPLDNLLWGLRLKLFRKPLDFGSRKHAKIIPVIILSMDSSTADYLIAINRDFYTRFGDSFSATRHRIQPGVRRVLDMLKGDESILDLGCGNGEFARELAKRGHRGSYLGVDFSLPLLREAELQAEGLSAKFLALDLTQLSDLGQLLVTPALAPGASVGNWSLITAFAVLHHIPSTELRLNILRIVNQLLKKEGLFIHSNWQFLNSEKLKARIQPWDPMGLSESSVDGGDYLLDWRNGGRGLRYVHHFEEKELNELAKASNFQLVDSFYSDGKEGNLGLYQIWKPVS
jgi:tRNA (uracil-5-)-methyltransferase TRM9